MFFIRVVVIYSRPLIAMDRFGHCASTIISAKRSVLLPNDSILW
jgi:hypothetical protein